jgi:hypothetical protein
MTTAKIIILYILIFTFLGSRQEDVSEISSSHGGKCEDDSFLGYSV